jgi:hypothetical protein
LHDGELVIVPAPPIGIKLKKGSNVCWNPETARRELSSSNFLKIHRQRVIAMSSGTQEFWVVDPEQLTVQITGGATTREYALDQIFAV